MAEPQEPDLDMQLLGRFYRHTAEGKEAARDWDVEKWSEENWSAKFDTILAFYKKKAAKAAKKGKTGPEADYQELMFGGIRNRYGLDPRTLPPEEELIAQREADEAEATALAAQLREKMAAKRALSAETGQLEVTEWLSSIGLERYAPHLIAAGYDQLAFLQGMDEDEADDVARSGSMLRPHARVFKTAARELAEGRMAKSIEVQPIPPSVAAHTTERVSTGKVIPGTPFAELAVGESIEIHVAAQALGTTNGKAPASQVNVHQNHLSTPENTSSRDSDSLESLTDTTDGIPPMHITVRPRLLYSPANLH